MAVPSPGILTKSPVLLVSETLRTAPTSRHPYPKRFLLNSARRMKLAHKETMAEPVILATMDFVGQTVGGFEILCLIGQGGMGKVYKARQSGLDRIVALKILSPNIAQDKVFIARFQREARASAKLNHPNVVQGIDAGWDEAAGVWFFAMEFVDGSSMLSVIGDLGRVPELRALQITRDVARGLECAHKHGMIHRDIKPDNILLSPLGEAKLADLGLAKQVSDDSGTTSEHQALGTPRYMSPEQARGDDQAVDIRSDIYALGATLFHFVTGQTPFEGKTSAVIMTKHINAPVPLAHQVAPGISPECGRLIQKMMQKRREDRFQTPTELVSELNRLIGARKGTPASVPAAPEPPPVRTRPSTPRMPAATAARTGSSGRTATGSRVRRISRVSKAGATQGTTSSAAARLPRTMLETPKPRFWRGLLIDLAVLIVVGGLAVGTFYYLRSRGKFHLPNEKPAEVVTPEVMDN